MLLVRPRLKAALLATGLGATLAAGLAVQPVHAAPVAAQAAPPVVLGTFRLTPAKLFLGPQVDTAATTLSFANVPSTVTSLKVQWDDLEESTVPVRAGAGRVSHKYKYTGTFAVTVTTADETGESTPRRVGLVSIKLDYANPGATLTKPKASQRTKVAAWRTIKGKASDAGSGVLLVVTAVFAQRNGKWYYYKGTTWKKGSPYKQSTVNKAYRYVKVGKGGAWSLKLKKLKKGKLVVLYYAIDKVGNHPYQAKIVQAKLTR